MVSQFCGSLFKSIKKHKMKKTTLSLLVLVTMALGLNAQNVNIPDANFKAYLVGNTAINTNGDTEIQVSEASAFTGRINAYLLNITDMTGLEAFTSLTELNCSENYNLATLDVSKNTALTYLSCQDLLITSLDLSKNTELTTLICNYNSLLTTLDVSNNTKLTRGYFNNGAFTSLNVANGNNINVVDGNFIAYNNPNLTCIQVDDVAYSTTNWTNIDATASYSTNCGSCIVNIPDANFKAALVANTAINTNGDTEIQCSEANTFSGSIILSSPFSIVNDMTGIEAFTQLTELEMIATGITTIDLSQNVKLEILNVYGYTNETSSLNSLDVSNNSLLTSITCSATSVTSLDLNTNTILEHLNISGSPVAILNITNCSVLSELYVGSAQLSTLNVATNTALTKIDCSQNQLTSLDVSNCSLLTSLNCSSNSLTSLNIANNSNSNFTSFDATSNPNLNCIKASDVVWCYSNLTSANNSIDANATFSFDCDQCYVKIPDANFKSYLLNTPSINLNGDNEIECAEAQLATSLSCIGQNISDLTGVEAFTDIVSLRCGSNQLSSLNVSANTKLTWIEADDNQLTTIDLSNNTLLDQIDLSENKLTALDLSFNSVLKWITLNNNALSYLNLANGNNTNIGTGGLYLLYNPDLTCVQVDDVAYSSANWTDIDTQTSFNTSCTVLVSSIIIEGQGGVSTISQGGTLQMEAFVLPTNATDTTYTWSVKNGTGAATISATGLLTATAEGTVDVTVTANDGSGITQTATITISNQVVLGVNEIIQNLDISIYPNPTTGKVTFSATENIKGIKIYNFTGKKVAEFNHTNAIDISRLPNGIYTIIVTSKGKIGVEKLIKE